MCFKPKKIKSTVEPSKYISGPTQTNIGNAESLSQRPYAQYDDKRVADFTGDQNSAFDFLRNLGSNATAGTDSAQAAAGAGAMQIDVGDLTDPAQLQKYMNTYINPVLSQNLDEMDRRGEMQRQDIGKSFSMDQAFGDARQGVVEAEQRRNQARSQNEMINTVNQQGFDKAMGLQNADLNRFLQQFGLNFGAQEKAYDRNIRGSSEALNPGLKYADALFKSGGKQQQKDQADIDVDYSEFLKEFQYPQGQADWLNNLLRTSPQGKVSTQPGPSTFSQVAGGLGQVAGLGIQAFNPFKSAPSAPTYGSFSSGLY